VEQESGFEQLFEEREWVRALAERLCADAATSEDLVQDTWLEALREGGKARGARGWLGGVLRNLVARRRTRDAARRDRERATARPEAVPGPDELLARAELQRRVLSAVANLPESYRSVVLLRHYEGLSAEDIARRSGESGSTVRNRLARAHALLRERLDRDYGERSLWSTLLVPVSWGVSKEVVTGGMLVGAKLYVTAAAVALVGVLAWNWDDFGGSGTGNASEVEAFSGVAPATEPALAEAKFEEVDTGREVSRIEPDATLGAVRVESVLLHGELLGAAGPLHNEALSFTNELGESRFATLNGTTYALTGLKPGQWRASAEFRGHALLDELVIIDGSTSKLRHDFQLRSRNLLPVKLVDASTGELLGDSLATTPAAWLSVVATRGPAARLRGTNESHRLRSEAGRYEPGPHPKAIPGGTSDFSGRLFLTEEPPLWAHVVLRDIVVATQTIDASTKELTFPVDVAALEGLVGSVVVRCVDALTRAPVAGVEVSTHLANRGVRGVHTDEAGTARLESLIPGHQRVSAMGSDWTTCGALVNVRPGEEQQLELQLLRRARISGCVLGPDGSGRLASVRFMPLERASDEDWWPEYIAGESDPWGKFDFPALGATRWHVVVEARDLARGRFEVDLTGGDVADVELRLTYGTRVVIRAALEASRVLLVVLVDATGCIVDQGPVFQGRALVSKLSPGRYELRAFDGDELVSRRTLNVESEDLAVELDPE
jgi:RNA polymerase sigma factor (sigma-70 family)